MRGFDKLAILAVIVLCGIATPAQAAYYGLPWSLGSSGFWATRALYNPRGFGYLGGGYTSAPLYWASSIYGAAAHLGTYGISPQLTTTRQFLESEQYEDDEPIADPRARVRPYRPSKITADQSVHAKWLKPDAQPFYSYPPVAYQQPGFTQPPGPIPPGLLPDQGWQPIPMAQPMKDSDPFALPPQVVPHTAPLAKSKGTPLSAGFVEMVNARFEGNIGKALDDSECRSWAKSLGLNTSTKLSERRIEVIKGILRDHSIDSVTKIETITALMRRN
jgi:hypothetical protein